MTLSQPRPATRILIAPDRAAPPVPCEECGYSALRIAKLVNEADEPLATLLVCTNCRTHTPLPELPEPRRP
ncbi:MULTISPECIES: hypothetical protein [Amycolatopsis]|uniref:Uncharacterized protein n=1 Tax=Amycolatopsis thermalba TaxID=944492 RepID=A0ABY4P3T7_9PSEU|nr:MULTISPECIES: hypothetical protein [Amycolatopsis]UQS26928.1 hypothetical protein L1857_31075 [Amycolatopsis thermalba]